MAIDPIGCQDLCGRSVADTSEAEAKAWTFLPISKRYRCPSCVRDLETVNTPHTKCPWCGASGPNFDESPQPSDYCHHDESKA